MELILIRAASPVCRPIVISAVAESRQVFGAMGCAPYPDEGFSPPMTEAKSQAPTDHELSERFAGLRERWDELRGRL